MVRKQKARVACGRGECYVCRDLSCCLACPERERGCWAQCRFSLEGCDRCRHQRLLDERGNLLAAPPRVIYKHCAS